MRILRIIIGSVFLALLAAGLIVPGDIGGKIMSIVASVQFFPALEQYASAGRIVPALLGVLLITLIFGRIYCSTVCPLGTLQDIFIRRKRKFTFRESGKLIRWAVPMAALLLGALGVRTLIVLLEPFALSARLGHNLVEPVASEFWHLIIITLRRFDIFLRPLPMALEISALLLALFQLAGLIALVFARGRLYCNSLCPVGAILSLLSRFSFFGIKINRDKCVECGKCSTACKAECLDLKNFSVDHARCLVCFSCTGKCPVNAISYGFLKRGKTSERVVEKSSGIVPADAMSRRDFIAFGTAAACSVPILGAVGKLVKPDSSAAISPPGSGSVARFNAACTGCQLCVNACPERVLRPAILEYGISGIQQPVMKFSSGYCSFECNKCGQVCPNGAILPLSLEDKQHVSVGIAGIDESRCVSFAQNKACGACAEVCPVSAVRMKNLENSPGHVSVPRMNPEICLGCGACENACPEHAIVVKGRPVHSKILSQPLMQTPSENAPAVNDFAF